MILTRVHQGLIDSRASKVQLHAWPDGALGLECDGPPGGAPTRSSTGRPGRSIPGTRQKGLLGLVGRQGASHVVLGDRLGAPAQAV